MTLITTSDLNKIKESILAGMKINFKNDGEISSMVIIIHPDGIHTYIQALYTTHAEKNIMLNVVKDVCKSVDAVAVITISEAWVKTVKPEEYKNLVKQMKETGAKISDFSDKKEVALMMYETKFTGQTITFEMDRANRELINEIRAETSGGDFANMLSAPFHKN